MLHYTKQSLILQIHFRVQSCLNSYKSYNLQHQLGKRYKYTLKNNVEDEDK